MRICDIKEIVDNDTCNGLVFKAEVNHFRTKRGFAFTIRLNEMKSLSCSGCKKCLWMHENISEISNDFPVIDIENAENGELYTMSVVNEKTDWESGIIDEWDIALVPFNKN